MNKKNSILYIILLVLALGIIQFLYDRNNIPQTPLPAVSNKININAVCEEALAYMTFENGEAADTFVEECKEGKHPEVIERYKAELNVGDGAAI